MYHSSYQQKVSKEGGHHDLHKLDEDTVCFATSIWALKIYIMFFVLRYLIVN